MLGTAGEVTIEPFESLEDESATTEAAVGGRDRGVTGAGGDDTAASPAAAVSGASKVGHVGVRRRPAAGMALGGRLALPVAAAALAIAAADALGGARSLALLDEAELAIDVGAPDDADTARPAFLQEGPGLSGRQLDGERTVRLLAPGATVALYFRSEGSSLGPDGVPYRRAVVETDYRDSVDETDCFYVEPTRAYCRPRLSVRLDYGTDRLLDWWPVAAIGGLADGRWKTSRVLLEATPWQTLRSIEGLFGWRLTYPDQLSGGSPLPLDRVVLRFADQADFHSLREADRAGRGLVRIDFAERAEPPPNPDASASYALYARSLLDSVFPNSVPRPSEILAPGQGLTAFEVAGEREPVSLSLYAYREVHGARLIPTDLVGVDGGLIPAERVSVSPVGVLDKRWVWGHDPRYGAHPWVLLDPTPQDVPAGSSRQFWVTVDVPADAPAGRYVGALRVATARDAERVVPLEMDVYRIDLAAAEATPYLYHSPYLIGKHFSGRFETALRDMADHDVFPIIYLDAEVHLPDLRVDMRDLGRELGDLQALGLLPPEPRVGIFDNAQLMYRDLCPGAEPYAEPCPTFDQAYLQVLIEYRKAFERYGGPPALGFADEPGSDPERRRASNYLNRLARQAGMRTWVTYYPHCEEALAGHRLMFDDRYGGTPRITPDWLTSDPHTRGYWDFTHGTADRTAYGNDGRLVGKAEVTDGALLLPDQDAAMRVPDAEWLDLPRTVTTALWMRVDRCPSDYARHPLGKWNGTQDANFALYLFGDLDGVYPENRGQVRVYANAGASWAPVSGSFAVDCEGGLGRWVHVAWTYDAEAGGSLLLDGTPVAGGLKGQLATNDAPLVVGQFVGAVDDVVILGRTLTAAEVMDLAHDLNAGYDREQAVRLRATAPAEAGLPDRLRISVEDRSQAPEGLETVKTLLVNRQVAWTARALPGGPRIHTVDVGALLRSSEPNEIEFAVTNGDARSEDLRVYWVDDAVRGLSWSVDAGTSDHWRHELVVDPSGALGPMDPELDERVYAMAYVSADEIARTASAGDVFAYYTTFPATQPVLVNNRFLNGLYASAVGARGVYVYAYGDWGGQPWDDAETWYLERMGSDLGRRGQGNYELVLPAWQDRMYDTVVYESLREGVEDSRVVATLRREIADHPGSLSTEAQQYLDDLLSGFWTEYAARYMYSDPTAPIERLADRSAEMLADLAGDPDAFGAFDAARRRMLLYAIALAGSGSRGHLPYAGR